MSEAQTSNALVDAQALIAAELAQSAKSISKPEGKKINTKGKVFTLPNGQSHPGPMRVTVIDWRNQRSYYTGAYNPNKPVAPACFASAKAIDDLKPSENCEKPQNEVCKGCAFDEFGSAQQGNGKACKNTVRVAVTEENATPESDVYYLDVSPTALKSFNAFVSTLEQQEMVPMQVVVDISFDQNETYPKPVFGEFSAHDNLMNIIALREEATRILDREFVRKD